MFNVAKRNLKLKTITFILFLGSCFVLQPDAFAGLRIPFETTKPIKFTVLIKDKTGNPTKARITFYEYKPPFKVDQSFGLKWKDLDFSTVEQVFVGFTLFETKEQYLSLHQGSKRKFLEERYSKKNFEEDVKKRDDIPLARRFNEYYSKIFIEEGGKKYLIAKSRFNGTSGIGLGTYFVENNKIKDSNQLLDDLSVHDLLVAYQDKDSSQFINWLKERQAKEGHKPSVIWILVAGIIVLVIISVIIRKILRIKAI